MSRAIFFALLLPLPVTVTRAADLRVQVTDIKASSGTVSAMLVDSEAAWNGTAKPVASRRIRVESKDKLELLFPDLAPGTYALRLLHDENDNGKLDSNFLGWPTEGYGFSNNPRLVRPAKFQEARFELLSSDSTISIVLR